MNKEIAIITAFFPIARENWKGFERSNNKYFEYFEFWARIQNDLVVYTTPEYKKRILKIREKFGRQNTKVITIDNPCTIDPEIYAALQKVAQDQLAANFRLQPKNPESWNADYNYIMLLKYWCLQDAAKDSTSDFLAWVDFGFNHGGELYINPENFNFKWQHNFSNKVHLFQIHDDDKLPIFEIIRRMDTYIQGNIVLAATDLCEKLWQSVRKDLATITEIGLMDDDQILLLMLARQYPELCELHRSTWFSTFRDFSNQKFEVKTVTTKNTLNALKHQLGHYNLVTHYLRFWKKVLYSNKIKG